MSTAIMTMAEVADFFRHESPGTRAADHFVRRLIARGLPVIRGVRPVRFLRHQVEAFAQALAEDRVEEPAAAAKGKRRRKVKADEVDSPIQARLSQMRARVGSGR